MAVIDYYLSMQSPWSFLGHDRIVRYAKQSGSVFNIYPCQFGDVFSATGGLPLPKRSPQRQAYRLLELERWSAKLAVEMNLQPKYFPANEQMASFCVVALREQGQQEQAIDFAGRVLKSVWTEEKDIGDQSVLEEILGACGADAKQVLSQAQLEQTAKRYAADTRDAIDLGVFGAPAYVVDGELFWGQDRLSFVAEKLSVQA